MIIFLDFDGVMHPVNQVGLFCREDHLARVLRNFPNVEIVISSAWRETHTLKRMQTFFLTDLRERIIGVTPVFQSYGDINIVPGSRYHEIQKYLADTDNRNRAWVALDDDPKLFPAKCAELVLCDGNYSFEIAAEKALRTALGNQR